MMNMVTTIAMLISRVVMCILLVYWLRTKFNSGVDICPHHVGS